MMPAKKDASSDTRPPSLFNVGPNAAWTQDQLSLDSDSDEEIRAIAMAFSREQTAAALRRVSSGGQAGIADHDTWVAAQHNWNMTDSRRTSGTTSPVTTRNTGGRERESNIYTSSASARRVSDGLDATREGLYGSFASYQNTNARQARNPFFGAEMESDRFQGASQAPSGASSRPVYDSGFDFPDTYPHNYRYAPAPSRTPSFGTSQASISAQPDLNKFYREKKLRSDTISRALNPPNSFQQGSQYGYSAADAGGFSNGAFGRNNGESMAANGYPQGTGSSAGHNGASQFGSGDGYRQTLAEIEDVLRSTRISQAMQPPMDGRGQEPIIPNGLAHDRTVQLRAVLGVPPLPYMNNYMAGTAGNYGVGTAGNYMAGTAGLRAGPNMGRRPLGPTEQAKSQVMRDFLRTASDRNGHPGKRRYEGWELTNISGHVPEFCLEENGSRFIQDRLPNANSEAREKVFDEAYRDLTQLSKDQYGNFVVQKLIEHGTYHQKTALLKTLQGKVGDWARDKYASRVVQMALEKVLVAQQVEILNEMKPILTELCDHAIGNHLVQKALRVIEDRSQLNFIYESVRGRVCLFARQPHGCRILSEMMKHGTDDDKAFIMDELSRAYRDICMDPMGNYVIQEALKHALPEDRNKVVDVIIANVVDISKTKSGSHVVELLIKDGTLEERRRIMTHVMACGPDKAPRLQGLCLDQYGNYVIKSLLQILQKTDEEAFGQLWDSVSPFLLEAQKTCTGKARKAIDSTIKALFPLNTTVTGSPFRMGPSPAVRTPSLTMEPQSPTSAVDEPINGSPVVGVGEAQLPHKDGLTGPVHIVRD